MSVASDDEASLSPETYFAKSERKGTRENNPGNQNLGMEPEQAECVKVRKLEIIHHRWGFMKFPGIISDTWHAPSAFCYVPPECQIHDLFSHKCAQLTQFRYQSNILAGTIWYMCEQVYFCLFPSSCRTIAEQYLQRSVTRMRIRCTPECTR